MGVRDEIKDLLSNSSGGSVRINNICSIRRHTSNKIGDPCDMMILEFDQINGVSLSSCYLRREIFTRDYHTVCLEIQCAILEFMNFAANELVSDLRSGYRNKD